MVTDLLCVFGKTLSCNQLGQEKGSQTFIGILVLQFNVSGRIIHFTFGPVAGLGFYGMPRS